MLFFAGSPSADPAGLILTQPEAARQVARPVAPIGRCGVRSSLPHPLFADWLSRSHRRN
ncbi:MAG: hypothetical protein M3177_02485 [Pseudomonadota bacterium]|nr:hypothetical protein [Pseudomonadota bacterium]